MSVRATLAATAVGVLLLGGCTGEDEEEPGNVFGLAPGDCFDTPGVGEFTDVDLVPCDQPHDFEVFHTFDLPPGTLPQGTVLDLALEAGCTGEPFTSYVGIEFPDSELWLQPIAPTPGTWDEGDREVVCAVHTPGVPLEGSVQGSGR
jgi:hypothetical protein